MKKATFLLTLVLMCLVVVVSGCNMEPKGFVKDTRPGMTNYSAHARMYRTSKLNYQMAWEDWDHLWLLERPSRNSYLRSSEQ